MGCRPPGGDQLGLVKTGEVQLLDRPGPGDPGPAERACAGFRGLVWHNNDFTVDCSDERITRWAAAGRRRGRPEVNRNSGDGADPLSRNRLRSGEGAPSDIGGRDTGSRQCCSYWGASGASPLARLTERVSWRANSSVHSVRAWSSSSGGRPRMSSLPSRRTIVNSPGPSLASSVSSGTGPLCPMAFSASAGQLILCQAARKRSACRGELLACGQGLARPDALLKQRLGGRHHISTRMAHRSAAHTGVPAVAR